jgi:hypothetical protein
LLKKFEDNARMSLLRYLKEMRENPKDEKKKVRYFKMRD